MPGARNGRGAPRRVPVVTEDEVREALARYRHAVTASHLATLVWWARGGTGPPGTAGPGTPVVRTHHVQNAVAALLEGGELVTALGQDVDDIGGAGDREVRHNVTYYALSDGTRVRMDQRMVSGETRAYLGVLRHLVDVPAPATAALVAAYGPVGALQMIEARQVEPKVLSETVRTGADPIVDIPAVRAGQGRDVNLIESGYARLVTRGSAEYPANLLDIGTDEPLGMWVCGKGNFAELAEDAVAVIGSRSVSEQGAGRALLLGRTLAERGYTVVSGGALGVDTHAHEGALAGGGPTIVVLPCGVRTVYPSANADLFARVIEAGGLLVSEYPPDARPDRPRFLQRNRLVAALGRATLVVEANLRSGTMNAARTARAYGRPVFAAPGSVGCDTLTTESIAWPLDNLDNLTATLTTFEENQT